MRNALPSECSGGEVESGRILKVCNGTVFDEPFNANIVYGFVDTKNDEYVYLFQDKKVKTLCAGECVIFRDGHRINLTFVEGEILEAVGHLPIPPARPGDLKKATGELFGIDGLKDIEVIVL